MPLARALFLPCVLVAACSHQAGRPPMPDPHGPPEEFVEDWYEQLKWRIHRHGRLHRENEARWNDAIEQKGGMETADFWLENVMWPVEEEVRDWVTTWSNESAMPREEADLTEFVRDLTLWLRFYHEVGAGLITVQTTEPWVSGGARFVQARVTLRDADGMAFHSWWGGERFLLRSDADGWRFARFDDLGWHATAFDIRQETDLAQELGSAPCTSSIWGFEDLEPSAGFPRLEIEVTREETGELAFSLLTETIRGPATAATAERVAEAARIAPASSAVLLRLDGASVTMQDACDLFDAFRIEGWASVTFTSIQP